MHDQRDENAVEHGTSSPILIAAAWALVMIPLAWGLLSTLQKALLLFP
ncbi:hypothetical protein SAMN05661010_00476 [Modicisalibacter muralis]|uniref:Oxalate:formate antiporter n=1 Tax=Modicisalibacter muralis TaxID=119000 RepID=A0A1G9FQB8_9GAMM|nr:hypothetical protein [Halomonas muralis]SDK90557.1 hypothetical protein SAMN05661010_00476 [Halomonas muralis]